MLGEAFLTSPSWLYAICKRGVVINIMHIAKFGILGFILLVLAACGRNELDREQAENEIERSEEITRQEAAVQLHSSAIDEGLRQGIFLNLRGGRVDLSDRAVSEISSANTRYLQPTDPIDVLINVTGIAGTGSDSPGRRVEFLWQYDGLSPLVRRYAIAGGSGTAQFTRFDDGWRLQAVSIEPQPQRFSLSSKDRTEIDQDVSEVKKRAQELQNLHNKATRRGAAIKRFEFKNGSPKWMEIYENGVGHNGNWTTYGEEKNYYVPFFNIIRFTTDQGTYGSAENQLSAFGFKIAASGGGPGAGSVGRNMPLEKQAEFMRLASEQLEKWRKTYPELATPEAREEFRRLNNQSKN